MEIHFLCTQNKYHSKIESDLFTYELSYLNAIYAFDILSVDSPLCAVPNPLSFNQCLMFQWHN